MINMSARLSKIFLTRTLRHPSGNVRQLSNVFSTDTNLFSASFDLLSGTQQQQLFSAETMDADVGVRQAETELMLNSTNSPGLLRNHAACTHIINLTRINAGNAEKVLNIKQDERFHKLLKLLERDTHNLYPATIIACLKALKRLDIPPDSAAVKNLENSLLWVLRSCPTKDLLNVFTFTMNQETEAGKKIFNEVCQTLERRWVELTDARQLVVLFGHSDKLSISLLEKLEDRLQDTVEDLSPYDLVSIFTTFGRIGRRSMPVLRSLGFHIAKNRAYLNIKQIADVLFACNKLAYKDQETLERLCSALESLVESNDNLAVVRSILTSLGQLKLVTPTVLDMISDWYSKRLADNKLVENRDLSTLLLTLANLNYQPFDREDFFSKVVEGLKQEKILAGPRGDQQWLNVVWALTVLNRASNQHFQSVLEPAFATNLLENREARQTLSKWLNVNAAASASKEYTGPCVKVSESPELLDLGPPPSPPKIHFKKMVFETLTTLFPLPRFMAENIKTGAGLTLDAEIIVDSNAKPLQVEEYTSKFGLQSPKKVLPNGAHRIAIFLTPFQETLIGGGRTGGVELNVRLAREQGYIPLVINHKTIDTSMKAISRVQKIDILVKQAIGKKSETHSTE